MEKEYITLYIDLHYNYIKNRHLAKLLEKFAEDKWEKNRNSEISLFYFTEGAEPTFEENIKSPDALSEIIKNDWKKRDLSESYFENGMFYCLSYLSEQAQKHKGTFRVIVISDIPSKKKAEYTEALMNLVETVRNFPTFIDIIRVGQQRFYEDDVKLRVITTVSSGGLFYVSGKGTLESTLSGLVKNKKIPDLLPEGGQIIGEDKRKYYEKLAKDLILQTSEDETQCLLCKRSLCNYCASEEDKPLSCPECGFTYHECCAANYSYGANIGLINVFRCVGCGALLKMDEEIVRLLNDEIPENVDEEKLEVWAPPKEKKLTKKEEEKIKEIRTTKITKFREEKQEEAKKESPLASRRKRRATRRFCRICAQMLKEEDTVCSRCGSPV